MDEDDRSWTEDDGERSAATGDATAPDELARLRQQVAALKTELAALRENEAHLRHMLQVPTVGIVEFDAGGQVTRADDAFLSLVGRSRADLDAGCVRLDGLASAPQGAGAPVEIEMVRRDGSHAWLLCAALALDERKGAAFVVDVTEWRRGGSGPASVLMWRTDVTGQRVSLHGRWLDYTGQTCEETQRGGWLSAIHQDDAPATARAFADAFATGRGVELVHRVRGNDGRYRWFLVRHQPARDVRGRITLWYGAAIDIDARMQAEAALQESEGRFRALADAAPALIWQFGADGRLAYVNHRYAEVTGRAVDELLPDGWRATVHPDDLAYLLAASGDAVDDRVPFHVRVRVRGAGGGWRWFEAHFAPWFALSGDYRGHVGIGIDITDGVQAEEALREADRRKDEFLAVLAHELRNPLAPISNAVQMLRCADGRRKADRVMEMANRQVKHITRLVDDLMEVSRISRGKIDLDREPVPLADILAAAVETSRPALDGNRHDFHVRLPDERLQVDGDKVRLTQVFSNLLNNAAKYTDPGGRIEMAAWREDGEAVVAVRDTGIGIPADKLSQVFGMFAQVEAAGTRSLGGLGIGLAMVHSLVGMHGGAVEARSAGPGRGSEFVVRLPLLPAAPPVPVPRGGAAPAPLAGCRVLVVDDNRDAADSLSMLLSSLGADAQVAYGGVEALQRLAACPPDAAVIDIGMPVLDGCDVARAVRADARLAHLVLVALTGWGQEADRARSRGSGFDHHLTKPVDLAALQGVLAGARASDPALGA